MPIFNFLWAELYDKRVLNEDEIAENVDLTQHLFNLIETEMKFKGFWRSTSAQNRLVGELQALLISERFKKLPNMFSKFKPIISRLMEWARENQGVINQ